MGFWENVNEELKNAVEESWSAVKDGARIGKLRYELHDLHKKARKDFERIGAIVYETCSPPWGNPLDRDDVKNLVQEIRETEAKAKSLEEEIGRIRKKEAAPGGPGGK